MNLRNSGLFGFRMANGAYLSVGRMVPKGKAPPNRAERRAKAAVERRTKRKAKAGAPNSSPVPSEPNPKPPSSERSWRR